MVMLTLVTATTFPVSAYVCQCPEPHPVAPDDAPEADIYLRISQDRTGEELGVDRQLPPCCKLAGALGYRISRVWTDNDKSATNGDYRPAFESLLRVKPKVIICWHTDRLVRLTKELERVIELKVPVHAVTAGYFDLSTPAGRATAKTVTSWAEYEGEQKVLRQKAAALQRAQSGRHWWNVRPFGFNMDATHVEDEAKALRQVYNDFLLGSNLSELTRGLNAAGFKTGKGNTWTVGSLRAVLTAHRNCGIRTYNGEEIGPAAWEPIVSEEVFRAVVYRMRDPARKTIKKGGRTPQNLLTKIAVCGTCGAPVRVRVVGRKGRENDRYYSCGGTDKSHVAHSVEWADSVVLNKVTELLQDPEFHKAWAAQPVTSPAEIEALRVEQAACRTRMEEADEDRASGVLSRQSHLTIHARNTKRLEEIEKELAALGSQSPLVNLLADLDVVWENIDGMSLGQQRALVAAVMKEIKLLPGIKGKRHSKDNIEMTARKGVTVGEQIAA